MTESIERESTQVEPPRRRRFSKGEKARIVGEYRAAVSVTDRGVVLRRWGTYQQNVSRWAREIDMASKPGKEKESRAEQKLARQLALVEDKLAKANDQVELLQELVEAQGKVLGLHAKNAGSPHQG